MKKPWNKVSMRELQKMRREGKQPDADRKYSLEELRELRRQGKTETRQNAPEIHLDEEFWKNAKVVHSPITHSEDEK